MSITQTGKQKVGPKNNHQEKYAMDPLTQSLVVFAGNDWRWKGSIDQRYKQYGAYYDNVNKKLQVQHQRHNKV